MTDNFESYLEQLNAMEQADNRAALNSFCALNKADLSFFKGIWEPLQTLLNSKNNFDPNTISQIKQILPKLASIKSKYLQLQRDAKPHCKEKINSFQSRIDSLNINNIEVVESELSTLALKNSEEVKKKEELMPLEDAMLKWKKLPIEDRVKVAKETYREDVMMRCLRDPAISVWKSLRMNPNITGKIRIEIDKKEKERVATKLPPSDMYHQPSSPENGEEKPGCIQTILGWIVFLAAIALIIYIVAGILGLY